MRVSNPVPEEHSWPGDIGYDLPHRNVRAQANDDTSFVDLQKGPWIVNDDKALATKDLLIDWRVYWVLGVALDFGSI